MNTTCEVTVKKLIMHGHPCYFISTTVNVASGTEYFTRMVTKEGAETFAKDNNIIILNN